MRVTDQASKSLDDLEFWSLKNYNNFLPPVSGLESSLKFKKVNIQIDQSFGLLLDNCVR